MKYWQHSYVEDKIVEICMKNMKNSMWQEGRSQALAVF